MLVSLHYYKMVRQAAAQKEKVPKQRKSKTALEELHTAMETLQLCVEPTSAALQNKDLPEHIFLEPISEPIAEPIIEPIVEPIHEPIVEPINEDETIASETIASEANEMEELEQVSAKVTKKRGRKPKGGKIIVATSILTPEFLPEPNIILHLKCKEADLVANTTTLTKQQSTPHTVETFQFENNNNLSFEIIRQPNGNNLQTTQHISTSNEKYYTNAEPKQALITSTYENNFIENQFIEATTTAENDCNTRVIAKKIKELTYNLHNNDILGKKSACFWCTCDFDNPPIFIPKHEINETYHCYGCFCSPECATAFLFKEAIDTSTRFERYHLLNHIYCKIYDYKKNIKPAPDPLYTLQKFYGNLSIQEYRKLLKNERLLLVVDKPLSRTLPELHEDNDDFLFSSGRTIPASVAGTSQCNNMTSFKLRKKPKQSKTEIVSENFNLK